MTTETKVLEQKCDATKLKRGDRLSRASYMKVVDVQGSYLHVENEQGLIWDISSDIVSKECYSANQAEEEIALNRTDLIKILEGVGDTIFTANFDKQPTAEDFLKLTRKDDTKIRSYDEMEKDFKKLKGENRTIVGYLIKSETGFGRSLVVDLEGEKDSNGKSAIRQIDHRTLNWIITKNKKYICKSK